jgi:hypothetical protein
MGDYSIRLSDDPGKDTRLPSRGIFCICRLTVNNYQSP